MLYVYVRMCYLPFDDCVVIGSIAGTTNGKEGTTTLRKEEGMGAQIT